MIIKNLTSSDQPFLDGKTNPNFFGTTSQTTGTVTETVLIQPPPYEKTIVITPPPYTSEVYLQPPAIVQRVDNQDITVNLPPVRQTVTVQPPSITQEVMITPPAYTQTVTKPGKTVTVNQFASVGFVQTWPYRLCALVKPNVVVGAKHYSIPIGSKVRFYGSNGYEEATIAKVATDFFDLEAYYLDRSVQTTPSPIFTTTDYASLSRREIVTFGLVGDRNPPFNSWTPVAQKAMVARILNVTSTDMTATCALTTLGSALQPGDSGAPSFILDSGIWKFFGSTWKINAAYTVNFAAPRAAIINSL